MLSTVARNSAASVVGTLLFALLMQLLGALPGTEPVRPYLLGTQFDAWHGFLRQPTDWAPVIRAARWLCALLRRRAALRGLSRVRASRRRRGVEPAPNARNGDATRRSGAAGGAATASLPWLSWRPYRSSP